MNGTRSQWGGWVWSATALMLGFLLSACTGSVDTSSGSRRARPSADRTNLMGAAAGAPATENAACDAGQQLCSGRCVDVKSDEANCGVCGKVCSGELACLGGQCSAPCSGGQTDCTGTCTMLATDTSNCGACGNACTAGRTCEGGACKCPGGQLFCGGACVDVSANAAHCGQCDAACPTGRSCVAGKCECDPGMTFCNGVCVDTLTTNEHCGACGMACTGGQSCQTGVCTCPQNTTFCTDNCLDTTANDAHCGGCTTACALGKSCVQSQCTGGGGSGADGCMGLAHDVTVSQIAAYQSVKVPIMDAGAAIPAADRNTDVVVGRDTLFRVFVTTLPGFTARELSARLVIVNGTATDSFYQKKMISQASTDADTASTFQLQVPKDKITAATRYYVELVECGAAAAGTLANPRFPVGDGDAELLARTTGALKIKIIPIQANGKLPDTSETALGVYRAQFLAMYPISAIEMTVGDMITTDYPIDWSGTLDQVRAKRQTDQPTADVYYYGLLKPEDTFKAFCGSSCTTGIGYVGTNNQATTRAALGVGFADTASAQTMSHEIAHNHGRSHAPCSPSGGNISNVDPNFPYAGAKIGVWGYDGRSQALFEPASRTDIMGYCSSKWVSDYTYDGLLNRIATVNGATDMYVAPEALSTWRVLLLDPKGPRWGVPITQPSLAAGEPMLAEALDAGGNFLGYLEAYVTEISDIDAWSVQIKEPDAGAVAVRIPGYPAITFAARTH
ncbi:MAG: MXAN_6577-like cysteine-rich protein [Polyangiaceae bacterium]|nr:MXAN_6577-like cysteine-rich protein [Polyangiaceae bacterium]